MNKQFKIALAAVFIFITYTFAQNVKTTAQALQAAFNGESNASNSYLVFSKATKNTGIRNLFSAISAAETIHATEHSDVAVQLKLSKGPLKTTLPEVPVGSDMENLKKAAAGEDYEWQEMYPGFSKIAMAALLTRVWPAFERIAIVEKTHSVLYKETMVKLEKGQTIPTVYYLCQTCGYVTTKVEETEDCPVCRSSNMSFKVFK